MFASRLSSSFSYSFFIFPIHSAFLLCSFPFHILLQYCFVSFAFSYWFILVNQVVGRIVLSLFHKVLFCLNCLILSRCLLCLRSFTNIFGFISSNCVVRLVCSCLFGVFSVRWFPVSFTLLNIFQFLYLSFELNFLSTFYISFQIPWREYLFYLRLVLILQRLTRSFRWRRPLGYVSVVAPERVTNKNANTDIR